MAFSYHGTKPERKREAKGAIVAYYIFGNAILFFFPAKKIDYIGNHGAKLA